MKILGYEFSQIQQAQQGDASALHGAPIDLSKPAKKPATPQDHELLKSLGESGLREAGKYGTLDRLGLL